PVGHCSGAAAQLMRASDPALYFKLARSGMELVQTNLSTESMALHWQDFLRDLPRRPTCFPYSANIEFAPEGRLSKWFGNRTAEYIRATLGIQYKHKSPGGEWPHSYGNSKQTEKYFDIVTRFDNWPATILPSESEETKCFQ